jgi:hypothetical protein
MPWSEYAPSVYEDHKASFSRDDNDTSLQRSYARSRGIPNFEKWGGLYTQARIGEGSYKALGFKTTKGFLNFRVINPPFEEAKHWNEKGSEAAKAWWVPAMPLAIDKTIYLAEAPLKAMAILEVGRQAVSTLSAYARPDHMPDLVDYLCAYQKIILAFDEGEEGRKCARHWFRALRKKGANVSVAFPIGGDWDSLLRDEKLDEKFLDFCEAVGGADYAGSPYNAIRRYEELTGEYPPVLEYRGCLYKPVIEKIKTDDGYGMKLTSAKEILDGVLRPAFAVQTDNFETNRTDLTAFLYAEYKRDGVLERKLVRFDAREITLERDFATALSSATLLNFTGGRDELSFLKVNILRVKEMPQVRGLDRYGYDPKTGAYVFPHFAFTRNGTLVRPNDLEYFDELNVKPPQMDNAIQNPALDFDMHRFTQLWYGAFGARGFTMFAYYLATLFSPEVFEMPQFGGFHPFISLAGLAGSGKSTLVTMLHYMFTFQHGYEGHAQGQSTGKGLLRAMARASCLPIVLSESNKGLEAEGSARYNSLDENSKLPLFNRQSAQVRANKSNDLSTNSVPFSAGLVFSQNFETFTLRAMKERTIAVDYNDTEFTDKQKACLIELQRLTLPDGKGSIPLSGVGVRLFSDRNKMVNELPMDLQGAYDYLGASGVTNERLRKNYTLLLGSLSTFQACYGVMIPDDVSVYIEGLARARYAQCDGESDTATQFYEALEHMVAKSVLKPKDHFLYDKDKIYVRLSEVVAVMTGQRYPVASSPILRNALRISSRCVKHNAPCRGPWSGQGDVYKVWEFRRDGMMIPETNG